MGAPASPSGARKQRRREHGPYLRALARKLCRAQLDPDALVEGVLAASAAPEEEATSARKGASEEQPTIAHKPASGSPASAIRAAALERARLARALYDRFLDDLLARRAVSDQLAETLEHVRPPRGERPWWQGLTEADVRAEVARLPADQRAAFEPFTFGGASYAELAARFELAKDAVALRIVRARRQLREQLARTALPPDRARACEHAARTSSCFDGALPAAEAADAIAHLAGCAACQALLGDLVGLDVVLGGAPVAPRPRRRPGHAAIRAALAASAAAALWLGLRVPASVAPPAAPSAPPPAAVAADPRAESDLAARALARGDLPLAIQHAYRALDLSPDLTAARWTLALAARALDLPRLARASFDRVAAAAAAAPARAVEAHREAAALAPAIAAEDAAASVERRGAAMVDGGPPLSAEDVARAAALARLAFLEAVRTAPDRARLDALRPLAAALDAHAGTRHATAMLDRADPALGARFGAAYRKLVDETATAAESAQLLAELRAIGPRADYLLAGALALATNGEPPWRELERLTAPWQDPWFDLNAERARISATWSDGDVNALPALEAAIARCGAAWALRCGSLLIDLSMLRAAAGRDDLALASALAAAARLREAGAPPLLLHARGLAAAAHRHAGDFALARAQLEEVALAATECDLRRYARIEQATAAADAGSWDAARALLPLVEPPADCSTGNDVRGLTAAVDLARRTGDARDVEAARRWIERTGHPADGGYALVALARIARGSDPGAAIQLSRWLREGGSPPPAVRAARAWGFTTQIADAGARGAWVDLFELAALEHPAAAQARCALVASADLDEVTVAARVEATFTGSHRRVAPAELATAQIVPDAIAAALAPCDDIAVIARPPLHARADLLPARLAWWLAGEVPGAAPRPGPPRSVEVTAPAPPDATLPPPAVAPAPSRFDVSLSGLDATPARVLDALADASYAELFAPAIVSAPDADAPHLALSPDPDGTFALRPPAIRARKLRGAPVIVLGAAREATAAPYLRPRWTLPDAFLAAGASAVIAADAPLSSPAARALLDELRRRLDRGEPAAQAVAALRVAAPADAAWARRLLVFR